MSDNNITIVGNLTKDPELKYGENGTAYLLYSIAVNRGKKNAQGEWENVAHYFDCVSYGDLAENIANTFSKGNRLIVSGNLQQRNWETPEGQRRSSVQILADEVGASVRWATALVTKTERPDAGQFNRQQARSSAPQRETVPATSSSEQYSFEEEPF
jgi:single-strand DNA-binding protein